MISILSSQHALTTSNKTRKDVLTKKVCIEQPESAVVYEKVTVNKISTWSSVGIFDDRL